MNLLVPFTTAGMLALLGVVFLLGPTLRPRIAFGRTVGEDFLSTSDGRRILRRYRLAQIVLLVLLLAAFLLFQPFAGVLASWRLLALLSAYVGGAGTIWFVANRSTRPYAVRIPLVRTAALVVDRRVEMAHLAALLPLAIGALVLGLDWARIPGVFPMHWNAAGAVNHWVHRTFATVYSPLLIAGAVVAALWAALRYATPGNSRVRWIFPAIAWYVAIMGTITSLLPLRSRPGALPVALLYAAPVMIVILCAVVILVYVRRSNHAVSEGDGTPDDRWIGGIFYYNPQDSALWVEKRMGIGWTLNFGHPASWLLLACILAVPIVLAIARLLARG